MLADFQAARTQFEDDVDPTRERGGRLQFLTQLLPLSIASSFMIAGQTSAPPLGLHGALPGHEAANEFLCLLDVFPLSPPLLQSALVAFLSLDGVGAVPATVGLETAKGQLPRARR